MDFSTDNDPWDWQGGEYYLQRDSRLDLPSTLWDEVKQNEDSFVYMLEETTPIKACTDVDFPVSDAGGVNKESESYSESSQSKRRRMLQFHSDKQNPSAFTNYKDGENSLMEEDPLPESIQWVPSFSDRCMYAKGDFSTSSEGWLADSINENQILISSDEVGVSGASDDQVDISEFCNIPPEAETDPVQESPDPPRSRCIFKGRKSFIRTPSKLATSVAYPFALIKPCGVQGDVTLKDINQRIRTPPPKPTKKEEPSTSYPTSAFSGKPVVVKTKIRTEGGKGSITIMRTRG